MRWLVAATIAMALAIGSAAPAGAQSLGALSQKAQDAGELAAVAAQQGFVRVIVHFASPVAPSALRADAASVANIKARVAAARDMIVAAHFGNAQQPAEGSGFSRGITRFEITPGFALNVNQQELDALAADPRVTYINVDRLRQPTLLQSLPLIDQPTAYNNGATGAGWAVAVLDTGVQSNHEFLSGKVVAEACFSNAAGGGGGVSLCPNGQSSQTGAGAANSTTANCISGSTNLCQHGTHVSGIAAGLNTSQSTGEPTNGVARDGKIFAVQVFTRFNNSTDCSPSSAPCVASYDSDQILALDYVFQHLTPVAGVNVASVNMSLGGGPNTSSACDSDPQKPAIDNLRSAGVLTAIASGNDGSTTQISHPACISSAVAVGSTTKGDVVSSFSNMATIVALLAPGGFGGGSCTFGGNNPDILSSFPGTTSATTNLYACEAGTSMATPHVAGAIAAIRTACSSVTANAILSAFQTSGVMITDTRAGGTITKPRIQLDAALTALNCGAGSLSVSPATDISSSGTQGGPFSPSSFQYQLSASSGSVNYSITGAPSWLDVSAPSGTATTSPTTVTFTVNASANSLGAGTYGPTTITFNNLTNGQGTQTRTATLTVNAPPPSLTVSPATAIAAAGNQGGPFFPSSFQYQLSTPSGSVNYSISGTPSWLDVSAASGTVTTSPTTITFTVNATANGLAPGGYNATISFTNTTNGQGNQTRGASLTVNSDGSGGGGSPARTFVSGVGTDTGTCSRSAPCATFSYALSQTAAGGEINCLNAGDYGPVTIDRAISILCRLNKKPNGSFRKGGGIMVAANGNGVTVNAGAADRVVLEGLDIDGLGIGGDGVRILAGKEIYITRCAIRNFTGNGVNMASSTSGGQVFINDSFIAFNAGGVSAQGTANTASITHSYILSNTSFAVQANGLNNAVSVQTSVLNNSPTGISLLNGGSAISVGPSNLVTGNSATFSSTTPFK